MSESKTDTRDAVILCGAAKLLSASGCACPICVAGRPALCVVPVVGRAAVGLRAVIPNAARLDLELTPAEARKLARALSRWADKVEAAATPAGGN